MKFLTPAFVRVENPAERQELKEWLMAIGYQCKNLTIEPLNPLVVCSTAGYGYSASSVNGKYDCGTNIALFKALAAMNDSNDREQWFVCTKSYNAVGRYWCEGDWFFAERPCGPDSPLWRKATADEIIKRFKNQTT